LKHGIWEFLFLEMSGTFPRMQIRGLIEAGQLKERLKNEAKFPRMQIRGPIEARLPEPL
jgi:hypothetical protein